MNRSAWLIGGLGALALGLVATWFLLTYEWVEEDVELPPSAQARSNEYLAAELLLDESGLPAESRFGLGPLPPTDHVVLVLSPDLESRGPLAERLTSWVEAGGHLVVFAARPAAELRPELPLPLRGGRADDANDTAEASREGEEPPDPLLEAAGLCVATVEGKVATAPGPSHDGAAADEATEEPSLSAEPAQPEGPARPKPPPGLREVAYVAGIEGNLELQAKLDGSRVMAVAETVEDGSGFGWEQRTPLGQVARVRVGEGTVTAVVDSSFMRNDTIGEHDHAELLLELVRDGAPRRGALLVLRGGAPSLLALAFRHGWMVAVSAVVLLAVWLWLASRRFGPVLPAAAPRRRSLLEHVQAAGAFLYRQGCQLELLESTRNAVKRRLAAILPAAATLEGGELAEAVSQETGARASRIHDAFYGAPAPRDRKRFTEAMRELQGLWRKP